MPDPINGSITYRDVYSYDPESDLGMREEVLKHAGQQKNGRGNRCDILAVH